VCVGLYLYVEKYTDSEEYTVFYVMIGFFALCTIYEISFSLYKVIVNKFMKDWVTPIEQSMGELEHLQADSKKDKPAIRKLPSPVS